MTKFNIGDRVRIRAYDELPEDVKTKSTGTLCGKEGEIVDIVFSNAKHRLFYTIHIDGYDKPSAKMFTEDSIEFIPEVEEYTYRHEFEYLENVVVARFIQIDSQGNETEIGRAHGHIIHEGARGIAQAASYAIKQIWFSLADE
jgi:hypothetical protein